VVNETAPFPEPFRNFSLWLGVKNFDALVALNFEELSLLPKVVEMGLEPLGAFPRMVHDGDEYVRGLSFGWHIVKEDVPYFRVTERFDGHGAKSNLAAIDALFCAWEYWTRRKSQSGG